MGCLPNLALDLALHDAHTPLPLGKRFQSAGSCRHSLNALGLVLLAGRAGQFPRRRPMQDDHVYRKTDLVGSSKESVTKAIETAIARAAKTLRHVEWFEVGEIRGRVQDGKVTQYQVSLKVGFRVEG
jgi:flavin-binding protein dodecin